MRVLAYACGLAMLLVGTVASAACEYQSANSGEVVASGSSSSGYPQSTPTRSSQPQG